MRRVFLRFTAFVLAFSAVGALNPCETRADEPFIVTVGGRVYEMFVTADGTWYGVQIGGLPANAPTGSPFTPPSTGPLLPSNAPGGSPFTPPTEGPLLPSNAPGGSPFTPPAEGPLLPSNAPGGSPFTPATAPELPPNAPTGSPFAPAAADAVPGVCAKIVGLLGQAAVILLTSPGTARAEECRPVSIYLPQAPLTPEQQLKADCDKVSSDFTGFIGSVGEVPDPDDTEWHDKYRSYAEQLAICQARTGMPYGPVAETPPAKGAPIPF